VTTTPVHSYTPTSTVGKSRYGSDLIVDLMQRYDIPYVALNPGSTFRGIHDSLVNYGGNRPEIILCQHEKIAVQIAHGYAKAIGKPMAAIAHDTVGLLHATNGIYYAYLDRAPIMLMGATGPMDISRRRPNIDWIHTSVLQSQPIRDYVKWDSQPWGTQDVIDSFARAYRVATQQPQGPVYLCYDAAFQEDELEEELVLPDPNKTSAGTSFHADPAALDQLADWLVGARQPVLIAGYMARHKPSFYTLVELAEATGAAVIDQRNRFNFPTDHPLNISGAQGPLLRDADVVVGLDVKDLFGSLNRVDMNARTTSSILGANSKVAEIGLRDVAISKWSEEFQQLMPVDLQVIADTAAALPDLLARVRSRVANDSGAQERIRERTARIGQAHAEARKRWAEDAKKDADASPLTTARLATELSQAIQGTDYVLAGANAVINWFMRLNSVDKPERFLGSALGTATQIGLGLGAALAYKGTGKLVVNVQPDGDLMFDAGALWTAANSKIPMLVVMHNNHAYYNDWNHQIHIAEDRERPVENAWVGQAINDPAPDFAGLARSMGWYAEGPFNSPEGVQDALQRAVREVQAGRPALVDTVTQFQ
jgi:acetolactate synthase-1/2/3 large subunit